MVGANRRKNVMVVLFVEGNATAEVAAGTVTTLAMYSETTRFVLEYMYLWNLIYSALRELYSDKVSVLSFVLPLSVVSVRSFVLPLSVHKIWLQLFLHLVTLYYSNLINVPFLKYKILFYSD